MASRHLRDLAAILPHVPALAAGAERFLPSLAAAVPRLVTVARRSLSSSIPAHSPATDAPHLYSSIPAPSPTADAPKLTTGTRRTFSSSTPTHSSAAPEDPIAFVFDVDGCLLKRNREVIPAALKAMSRLYTPGKDMPRLPLAFLTNSGGMTERRKAAQLSSWLDVPVTPDQVVLSHTPYRSLAAQYGDVPVLVVGRGDVMEISKSYGFRKTVTTAQLAKAVPAAVPLSPAYDQYRGGPSSGVYIPSLRLGTPTTPIRAVFVFSDPDLDWYSNLQLIVDVIVGGGVIGRRWQEVPEDTPPVKLFFSNPDILWANEHPAPRFGQGAFAACVQTLFQAATGTPLPAESVSFMGKPHAPAYRTLETLLTDQAAAMGLLARDPPFEKPPFSAIYAIGDTRDTDIRGANNAGRPWHSVLVMTGGVKYEKREENEDPADLVADDVDAAVVASLEHADSMRSHGLDAEATEG